MSTLNVATLKATTIQDASGLNPSTPLQISQGRAKAWVNFNGTGVIAVRDGFNISSLVDAGGVGNYQVVLAAALADLNYSPIGTACLPSPGHFTAFNSTTTVIEIRTALTSAITTGADCSQIGMTVLGDGP